MDLADDMMVIVEVTSILLILWRKSSSRTDALHCACDLRSTHDSPLLLSTILLIANYVTSEKKYIFTKLNLVSVQGIDDMSFVFNLRDLHLCKSLYILLNDHTLLYLTYYYSQHDLYFDKVVFLFYIGNSRIPVVLVLSRNWINNTVD